MVLGLCGGVSWSSFVIYWDFAAGFQVFINLVEFEGSSSSTGDVWLSLRKLQYLPNLKKHLHPLDKGIQMLNSLHNFKFTSAHAKNFTPQQFPLSLSAAFQTAAFPGCTPHM